MWNQLYRYSVALVAITGMVACNKVPKGILSERKMKDVMVDMYLAEGLITADFKSYPDSIRQDALFQSVFSKHKITQALYDSSLVWYGENPDILMQVYDIVLNEINNRMRDLGDVQASTVPTFNQDSVNIWPRRDYLVLKPDALFNGVLFDIKPDRYYSSGSGFVLGMRVWGLSANMKYMPELHIAIDQGDTTIITNRKITNDGYHQAIIKGVATKQIYRVYGYLRMDNTDAGYYKIYIDSLNLMKYNYRSPAMEALSPTDSTSFD